VKSRRRNI